MNNDLMNNDNLDWELEIIEDDGGDYFEVLNSDGDTIAYAIGYKDSDDEGNEYYSDIEVVEVIEGDPKDILDFIWSEL